MLASVAMALNLESCEAPEVARQPVEPTGRSTTQSGVEVRREGMAQP